MNGVSGGGRAREGAGEGSHKARLLFRAPLNPLKAPVSRGGFCFLFSGPEPRAACCLATQKCDLN